MSLSVLNSLSLPTAKRPVCLGRMGLAFIGDRDGSPQAWMSAWNRRGGLDEPTLLNTGVERVRDLTVSPDGALLIVGHDRGGNEQTQLLCFNPRTGERRAWTDGLDQVRHLSGAFSSDGRWFLYASNRRHRAVYDLYRQPVPDGEPELILTQDQPGSFGLFQPSPDGRRILVNQEIKTNDQRLLEVDTESGTVRPLHDPAASAAYPEARYSPDGKSLWVVANRDRDCLAVMRVDMETHRWTPVIEGPWDIETLALSPDGRFLAYGANEHGVSRWHVRDLQTGEDRPAPLPADMPCVAADPVFDPDGQRLIFSLSTPFTPSDIWIWDFRTGRADPTGARSAASDAVNEPEKPTMRTPVRIEYPGCDGRPIAAWYYRPLGVSPEQPLPTVVNVHGGPAGQYRPGFDVLAHILTCEGYAVLAPNVRGSKGYGKTWTALDDKRLRLDSVDDLACAARWLQKQPGIDAGRIAVHGRSYGGFMVLSVTTRHPDLWAAAIDVVGISDMVAFLENTSDYRRPHREAEYGTLAEDRDFLKAISPVHVLDRLAAPLLVVHGRNDPRVPVSETERLVDALRRRNHSVEALIFEDEGHDIGKRKNQVVSYDAIVAFLKRTLG